MATTNASSFFRFAATSFLLLLSNFASGYGNTLIQTSTDFVNIPSVLRSFMNHRKLLVPDDSCSPISDTTGELKPNRSWGEDVCSESDIAINQGPSNPLPNGIPTYSVAIRNACSTGCDIGGIHLRCGEFSTAKLINPDIFKRVDYDDCLVYGGKPIPNGMTLSFQYANTYPYPMDVIEYECSP